MVLAALPGFVSPKEERVAFLVFPLPEAPPGSVSPKEEKVAFLIIPPPEAPPGSVSPQEECEMCMPP